MHEPVLAFLLLTYPSGRADSGLNGIVARIIVVSAPLFGLADLLTRETADQPCTVVCSDQRNPFLVVDLGTLVAEVSGVVLGIFGIIVLVLVGRRFIRAGITARRTLAPVLLAGILGAGLVVLRQASPGIVFVDLFSGLAQILIPLALGFGFLRSRMARAGVADLVLGAGPTPTLRGLEDAVRRTLHDPSARLARWSEAAAGYNDEDGRPIDVSSRGSRQTTLITGSRGRLAALTHDPILAEEGDLLPSVAAAVRIVLENEVLATSLQAQTAEARRLPTGRLTLIRTDVESSTELLEAIREEYATLISDLRRVQRSHVRAAGGTEIDSRADEFFGAVPDSLAAVEVAIEIQQEVAAHRWPGGATVRLRIGLHTGEPTRTDEGYVGMDVHLTARVAGAGHGGQIVVSDATKAAVEGRRPEGISFVDLGTYRLKGIPIEIRLHQVVAAGLQLAFPPLRAESSERT